MADYKHERDVTFGVFCKDTLTDEPVWFAYSRWYNPAWSGFAGEFVVRCKSHREGVRKAIEAAKRAQEQQP